jgi:hypothetical protein
MTRVRQMTVSIVVVMVFAFTLGVRVWGITRDFWLAGDQIRDWTIALRAFTQLPLVGPSTHSGESSIGPAFYWGLWLIRVTIGPWFQNLPHSGGIGQALLDSTADALLLAGIWKQTRSVWLAMGATFLIASASYDVSLSAAISNPMMGSALARIAMAIVLLRWSEHSPAAGVAAAAAAWCAVQCFTGTIFAALGIFVALLAAPLLAGNRDWFRRSAWTVAVVIALLQVPHAVHVASERPRDSEPKGINMANFTQVPPYDYLPLMPAAALTLLLTLTAVPSRRVVRVLTLVAFAVSLAVFPARFRVARTMHRMPEYGVWLDGSRRIARRAQPIRNIQTEFILPPDSDPEFLYVVLGGRIDRESPWVALIKVDGAVVYQRVGGA